MRKETVDIDILVTSRNGDRTIMQSIRITSRPRNQKKGHISLGESTIILFISFSKILLTTERRLTGW